MKTNRVCFLISLAVLCLLLTSCFDSTVPLSEPDKSEVDERLAGVWRVEGKKGEVNYYHIGRFGDSLPESVMRVVGVTHTKDGKIRSAGELLIFPTTIEGKSFLNVTGGQDQRIKLVAEQGWTPETVATYLIFRYQVTGDSLTVQGIDRAAKQRAIEGGKIKGVIEKRDHGFTKVVFTDTTENLARFVAENSDDLFSKEVVRLERVK